LVKVLRFFREKKPWSRYKDLILDYYLTPYLAKVATLNKPILVVDCFAGPGKFDDGELGSPLIIARRLQELHLHGIKVLGFFIEDNSVLHARLLENTATLPIPVVVRQGSFRDHVSEISQIAQSHTVFVYLDPIKPSDLHFDDLRCVYDQLKAGQSVETLINFPSRNFLRAVWSFRHHVLQEGAVDTGSVRKWNSIAGGSYWQQIAFYMQAPTKEKTDMLAEGYADQLHKWFRYVLTYPIRKAYKDEFPKYHLIFGSRSPDAVDLMNRGMVQARRRFLGAQFKSGRLFNMQPEEEDVDAEEIQQAVIEAAKKTDKTTWRLLRVNATLARPCMYTDSEFNQAIKAAIKSGRLASNSAGEKIEDNAIVWLPS